MKAKRITAAVISAVMMLASLAGCSGGNETTTTAGNTTTTVDTTTAADDITAATTTTTAADTTAAEDTTTAADTTAETTEENMTAADVVLTKDSVKLVGRTYLENDVLWTALSGAGAEFVYTGKKLDITIVGDSVASTPANDTNYARVGIYVDGERVIDDMLNEAEKTYTAFESAEAKTVNVQIIKLSECAMSTFGIKPIHIEAGESIVPAAEKQYKIEFIGDSITCGYGVDDEDKDHHFSTATEDVTKAYAYKTAQKLGADYSMFSISGYGVISGYTDDGNIRASQTIPQYYEKLGFSYGSFTGTQTAQSVDWDFSNYQPDVVVINLGTNDNSYCKDDEKKEVFRAAYVEFLKMVRKHNPDAKIMCTLGIMGGDVTKSIKQACDDYTAETGDANIFMFRLTQQSSSDGLAADWHPTERTHEKASDKVAEQIKAEMGW